MSVQEQRLLQETLKMFFIWLLENETMYLEGRHRS